MPSAQSISLRPSNQLAFSTFIGWPFRFKPLEVTSFELHLDDRIKFEISNGLTTLWVYDYDLTTGCNDLLLQQYSQADEMIKLLSA